MSYGAKKRPRLGRCWSSLPWWGRIITRLLGQRVDTDHAGLIDAKVEFPPATPAAATVFRGRPLTLPDDGQTCRSRIRHQAAAGSWTMPRQWEIQRTWLNSARAAVRSPAKPNGV